MTGDNSIGLADIDIEIRNIGRLLRLSRACSLDRIVAAIEKDLEAIMQDLVVALLAADEDLRPAIAQRYRTCRELLRG